MSKSLGNFFTLRDLLAKGFTGREIRYLLLTAHYRETFNFTLEGLQGARAALARIDECLGKLREAAGAPASGTARPVGVQASACSEATLKRELQHAGSETGAPNDLVVRFTAALDDDLNISAAWVRCLNGYERQTAVWRKIPWAQLTPLSRWPRGIKLIPSSASHKIRGGNSR